LLPQALCRLSTRADGDDLVPEYLEERDEPWLAALLGEHARFVGRPREELRARLRAPSVVVAPKSKRRMATHVLDRLAWSRANTAVPPREARWLSCCAAAVRLRPREQVLAEVAGFWGTSASEVDAALFADLPHEQRVAPLPPELSARELRFSINQALLASLLRRAVTVRIRAWGGARALVRHARQLGLICVVRPSPEPADGALRGISSSAAVNLDEREREQLSGVELAISGPFALFRRTGVYDRALASLVPRAAACSYFELEAECALGRGSRLAKLRVRTGDPIGSVRVLPPRAVRLEARFVREFRRVAPDWEVLLDPSPVKLEAALVVPDFELVHRRDPGERWWIEVLGFWTPDYLNQKLVSVERAQLKRLILCIDEKRCCNDEAFPAHPRVIRYRTRIPCEAVLQVMQRSP
jgi:predicted nuclease of restriction endonuclease-like RecB superfamily